jgi:hypothetical protein
VLTRFPGLSISSTLRPGDTGSYHSRGMAVDLAGPSAVMRMAAGWIGRAFGRSLLEGIHNPNLSIKHGRAVPSSFWGAGTWAAHANHIHLAAAALGALGPVAATLLGALGIGTGHRGGLPGAMQRRGAAMFSGGLRTSINRILGRMGGAVSPDARQTTAGGYSKGGLMALARSIGFPDPNLAAAVALAESSGNPNAMNVNRNGTIDRGLWMINSIWGALSTFDPVANARAAFQISQGGLNWNPWVAFTTGRHRQFLARGGRVGFGGWFGDGGQITASRPTLIGLGDRGTETATITRGRSIPQVTIQRMEIVNNRAGDIRRQVREEIGQALNDLADDLELGPIVSDQEAMR